MSYAKRIHIGASDEVKPNSNNPLKYVGRIITIGIKDPATKATSVYKETQGTQSVTYTAIFTFAELISEDDRTGSISKLGLKDEFDTAGTTTTIS
jgi:hypothetical protein